MITYLLTYLLTYWESGGNANELGQNTRTSEWECFCDSPFQNNAAQIVHQASRWSHAKPLTAPQLHWLPVQQRITYKLAVLTYKVLNTSTPVYLHDRITERVCSRTLLSSSIPLLVQPFTSILVLRIGKHAWKCLYTDISRRAFRFSAPSVWNSLPQTVLIGDSLSVLNLDLQLFYSLRLSLNNPSYIVTTVRRYISSIIIIIIINYY